jgi:hypothetical protein
VDVAVTDTLYAPAERFGMVVPLPDPLPVGETLVHVQVKPDPPVMVIRIDPLELP